MVNRITDPTELRAALDYQAGSVVSQVLFRNESGTVTAFAFAEGEGLSPHSNPNDATLFVLEGSVRVTIGEREVVVQEGAVVHLPADVPHELHGGQPFKMLLTLLERGPGA